MTADQNKHITQIKYNHLNLPIEIQFGNGKIYYTYDAAGTKLKKQVQDAGTITRTDYVSGYQYKDNVLQFFPTAEGYVNKEATSYKYVYNYTDHLGNVRLSYADNDGNGSIDTSEILEENNYYAFGLKHKGYNGASIANDAYKYKYNGKELQDELGLDWYDYGARNYDASLGRWMNVDPHAESYFSMTPYSSFANNPISFIDPTGKDILFWQWDIVDEKYNQVSFKDLDSNIQKGLENFAKTKAGKSFLGMFANKEDKLGSVEFNKDGKYANHNLNFKEEGVSSGYEGKTHKPINRQIFGPTEEGKTNRYIDFDIELYTYMDSPTINIPETIAHELFGHLDQYLDDYINAFEKSGSFGANIIYDNYRNDNYKGYKDHFELGYRKLRKYNDFVNQLKGILNPNKVQNFVDRERNKNIQVAKRDKKKNEKNNK